MKNDFSVTRDAICQWFLLMISSLAKIIGKSPHSWRKKNYSRYLCITLYYSPMPESWLASVGIVFTFSWACVSRSMSTGDVVSILHHKNMYMYCISLLCCSYIMNYGGAKGDNLWCKIMYAIPKDSSLINISNTNVQVAIYDILVSWICCHL